MRRSPLIVILACLIMISFSAFAGRVAALEAETGFTTEQVTLSMSEQGDAQAAGRLDVATRLEIVEKKDDWLRVRVIGWHQQGGERVIFEHPGKRVLALVLKKKAVAHLQRLHTIVLPETGITWHEVSITGFIRETMLVQDISKLWEKAEGLFSKRCTVCHQRRIPDHYSVNQWRSYLKIMGPRTGLPKADQQLILKYLQYQARDAEEMKTTK